MNLALGVKALPRFSSLTYHRPGLAVPGWWVTISMFLSWGCGPAAPPPC
jgi:hypothetical protein